MKIVVGNEDRNLSRRRYRRIVGRSLHPEDDRNAGNQSGVGDHFFAHEHPHLSGQDRRAAEDRTVAARRHVGPFGKGSAAVGVRRRERTADSRFAGRSAALCQDVGSGAVRRDRVRKSGPFLLLVSGLLGCGREYPAGRPFARAGRRVWTAAYPYAERMEAVRSNLALPEGILPLCVIPIGYPAAVGEPKRKFDAGRIHYNGW